MPMDPQVLFPLLQNAGAAIVNALDCWNVLYQNLDTAERVAEYVGCNIEEVPPKYGNIENIREFLEQIESIDSATTSLSFPAIPALPESLIKMVKASQQMQEAHASRDNEVRSAIIDIEETLPFAIAFPGDFHIGSRGTHHTAIMSVCYILYTTPGLYCAFNGDLINNYIARSYEDERHSQSISPGDQKDIARVLMEWLAPKCLALTSGQHEYWSIRQDDFDPAAYFAKHAQCVYLGTGGQIEIVCSASNVKYILGMYHQYKGNSIYDQLAAAKRCYLDHGAGLWDITIVADKHEPAISKEIKHGAERVFVRCGTAKLDDPYSRRLGFKQQRFYVPVVVLDPNNRRFDVFMRLSSAIEYLAYLRS